MVEIARRSLIKGLIAFGIAAPSIVRATSLMSIRSYIEPVTMDDMAKLLSRLEERSSLPDHWYAERHGLPVMGTVDEKTRQVIAHG